MMSSKTEDKCISTDDDFLLTNDNSCNSDNWNFDEVDRLLNSLLDNKLQSIKEYEYEEDNNHKNRKKSYNNFTTDKSPPDKSPSRHRKHCHRHSHHHRHSFKHSRNCHHHSFDSDKERHRSFCKVKKWSEDNEDEDVIQNNSDTFSPLRNSSLDRNGKNNDYILVNMEKKSSGEASKRRRKRRRKPEIPPKTKVIDPQDLPKRARWTIIITSGLLIMTCMFLVGITLRMAPVIDQMVRTQNEELMNSLNRNNPTTAKISYQELT